MNYKLILRVFLFSLISSILYAQNTLSPYASLSVTGHKQHYFLSDFVYHEDSIDSSCYTQYELKLTNVDSNKIIYVPIFDWEIYSIDDQNTFYTNQGRKGVSYIYFSKDSIDMESGKNWTLPICYFGLFLPRKQNFKRLNYQDTLVLHLLVNDTIVNNISAQFVQLKITEFVFDNEDNFFEKNPHLLFENNALYLIFYSKGNGLLDCKAKLSIRKTQEDELQSMDRGIPYQLSKTHIVKIR